MKLAACPFCGHKRPRLVFTDVDDNGAQDRRLHFVQCQRGICGAVGPRFEQTAPHHTPDPRDRAVAAWNARR